MNEEQLRTELRDLAARLSRLERLAGLTPSATPEKPEGGVAEAARPSVPVAPAVAAPPAVVPVNPPPGPIPDSPKHWAPALARVREEQAAPIREAESLSSRPAPRRAGPSWEAIIGERWMAWVGAIVVVVAVGFFVKLAYDLGWWGRLGPLAKCLVAAGFGAALCSAGEVALRRVGRVAAVSLFGAGLGTLYLTAYATFRFFDLLPPSGAFWLMLLVAVLGIGITLRGRLVAIGVLALLGGYLSPILLAEQRTFPAALPLYLTALLVFALGLSVGRADPFRLLRYVGLALHAVVAVLWVQREGTEHWLIALVFLTLWWGAVTAEALLAALRGQSRTGNPVTTLLFTFWYVCVGCGVLGAAQPGARDWLGLFAGAVAAISAWIALPIGPGLSVLQRRPRQAMERLAVALWGQVGVLLAAAIGLQYRATGESFGQSIGWLVMGVACIELGRRLPSRGVDVFGLLVGGLGLARVWSLDVGLSALSHVMWSYGDARITYWAVLALGAITATQVIARRLSTHGASSWAKFCSVLTFASTVQWTILCVAAASHLTTTALWLLAAVALLLTVHLRHSRGHRPAAMFLLVLATAKLLAVDMFAVRLGVRWSPLTALPLLNWQMAVAALACLSMYVAYRAHSARVVGAQADGDSLAPSAAAGARTFEQAFLVAGTLVLLIALSFEIDRLIWRVELGRTPGSASLWTPEQARGLWITLLWAIGGLVNLATGYARKMRLLFGHGWLLISLAVGAWLIYDSLYWRMGGPVVLSLVIVNLQFGVGLVLFVILVAEAVLVGRRDAPPGPRKGPRVAEAPLIAAIGLLLVALSFEVDRLLGHIELAHPAGATDWLPVQASLLWWTLLWSVGGLVSLELGWRKNLRATFLAGWTAVAVTGGAWLLVDTLYWRLARGVTLVPVVLNAQFGVGIATAAAIAVATRIVVRLRHERGEWLAASQDLMPLGVGLIVAMGLMLGSLELDRLFAPEAQRVASPEMARQTALSIFWGVYAIGLVALGFWRRAAWLRYAGLGLLAVTLGKVLIVDLEHVQYMYRVLSLLAVGLLFIATSVAYARLAARLGAQGR